MSSEGSKSSGGGISFGGALFLVFLVLKLTHVIDWSWWWITAPIWGAFVVVALVFCVVFLVVSAMDSRKRARRMARKLMAEAEARRQDQPEPMFEVRDRRGEPNVVLRAWDVGGREMTEAERVLVGKPPGMGTGSCSNPAHASQHPPHVETDAVFGEYWCVGGWVRTDGTIPGGA